MRYIVQIIAIAAIIFTGCTDSTTNEENKSSSSILGQWELSKEVVKGKTLDFSAEEIKTVLSFEKEAYFIYFDDLTNSGLSDKVAKIQTHYKGQYAIDGDQLSLTYVNDSKDFEDKYTVKSNTDTELVLLNQKNSKVVHYTKR